MEKTATYEDGMCSTNEVDSNRLVECRQSMGDLVVYSILTYT
jgi:hypothetical protein